MSSPRQNAELVFAFVAPVGTDYQSVADHLHSQLFSYGYDSSFIKLSDAIATYCRELGIEADLKWTDQYERIHKHMHEANRMYRRFNEVCDREERNALLALHALSEVHESRLKTGADRALLNRSHINLTLKRPEEVTYLRRVYGPGLHVISVFSPEEDRVKFLVAKRHLSKEKAVSLVKADEDDREDGGQRTGDAFHLADLFIDTAASSNSPWALQIERYLELLFSHPYRTPTIDEQAMFMAHGASLRSAQFGRQVGAAITNQVGDVLAIGCNEVPSPGGGLYWEGSDGDNRDHVIGKDSNDDEKRRIYYDILSLMPAEIGDNKEFQQKLRQSSLFSITEFGRAVHAEMEALSSCARRGVSTQDVILYTTTFPCHNCARHIVGFGVKQVVYIEPYPKSKATLLHDDAITSVATESTTDEKRHVRFTPFVGISPRRYSEMFTTSATYGREVVRKVRETGNAVDWNRQTAEVRLQMYSISYIDRERVAVKRSGLQLKQRALSFDDQNIEEETT